MKTLIKDNFILFFCLLILNVISLFNMVNSKLISDVYKLALVKQWIWFIIGYLLIFIFNKVKVKKIFKYAKYLYFFSLGLLVLVLFVGKDLNGAKCWLNVFGFSFQPSELAKLTLSLYLVEIVSKSKITNFKSSLIVICKLVILTIIPSILVFLEPDTGAIINFLIILLVVILFIPLNKWWYISLSTLLVLGLIGFGIMYYFYQDLLIKLIGTSFFYRVDRLINFTNGNSYQLEQALTTIGASSFLGVGLNKILLYIPEAPTDFFFAFTAGNFGLLSCLIILFTFLILDIFLIYKTKHLKIKKYQIFIYTYFGIFIFHQIYNIGMNLGLLPIMGIPLPFLSYGGTSILINYLYLAIILNLFKEKNNYY